MKGKEMLAATIKLILISTTVFACIAFCEVNPITSLDNGKNHEFTEREKYVNSIWGSTFLLCMGCITAIGICILLNKMQVLTLR